MDTKIRRVSVSNLNQLSFFFFFLFCAAYVGGGDGDSVVIVDVVLLLLKQQEFKLARKYTKVSVRYASCCLALQIHMQIHKKCKCATQKIYKK